MTRTQLLLRLLLKAAWVRKDRAFTALVSVAVVATIATAALTIYSDLESKLSREFRGFGANIVVTKNFWRFDSRANWPTSTKSSATAEKSFLSATPSRLKPQAIARIVVGGADMAKLRHLNSSWSFSNAGQGSALGWMHASMKQSPTVPIYNSRSARRLPSSSRQGFSIPAPTTTAASIFLLKILCASPASSPTQLSFVSKASRRKFKTPFPA